MNELRITTINLLFHFTSLELSEDEVTVAIPAKITMEDHMKHLDGGNIQSSQREALQRFGICSYI